MQKENNCRCVVCQVERSLLNSLSTQTARTQFQALAHNYAILNHFDSPADVIAQLHQHERIELVNHEAWNGILHALVESIADRSGEEIGQQLLLLAFMPAIHRTYAEVCQLFPALGAEDIAQQGSLVFLQATRSQFVTSQNGYLPVALAKEFRRRLFRWAFLETRRSLSPEELSNAHPEPQSDANFEDTVLLQDLLSQWQRGGVLSQEECDLLRKFKCEGFEAKEMAETLGPNPVNSHRRLHRKLQTILNRLQRAARTRRQAVGSPVRHEQLAKRAKKKKNSNETVNFSGSVAISNSESGNSPELTRPGTQRKPEVPPIAA